MSNKLHNELRKEFQLERMILFSDAVFAIAITLMVIEIKIPELPHENISDKALLKAIGHLIPKFIGFIVSFIFIGLYWSIHHRMFGFVTDYSPKLIRLNLLFLFFIAVMPFSTGFYSEYGGSELVRNQLKIPLTFYVLNFFFSGLVNYLMWRYITNPKNKVAIPAVDPEVAAIAKARAITVPLIFLVMLPVAYLTNVVIAVYIPLLIPVILRISRQRIRKKFSSENKS